MTEADLLAGLKEKRGAAVQAMVDGYGDRLLRTAAAVTGDRQTAEDVVQETLLQACRKVDSFRGESALLTWLLRIAVNIARNKAASWWGRRVTLLSDARLAIWPAAAASDPAAAYERREAGREVLACLRRLPVRYREVLALHYLEECSVAEISGILGIAQGTVKSTLARGRAKLREIMASSRGEDNAK